MKLSDKAKMIKLDDEIIRNIPKWGEQNRKYCRLILSVFLVRLKEFRKARWTNAAKGRKIGNYYVLVKYQRRVKEKLLKEECIRTQLAYNKRYLIKLFININSMIKTRRMTVIVTRDDNSKFNDFYNVNETITL